jgi:hypothetical protein
MSQHIGPYQRPAPPKRPLGFGASKTIQKPAIPMHEIEARAEVLLQGMIEKVRKPGRPSVHEEPMTPAERQARRRGIQDALRIGDGDGKSREEAASGGYGSTELDTLAVEANNEGNGTVGWRHVKPNPNSDDGKSHKVHVRGLRMGDEETNRRLFAENELRKMVGEHFVSPTVSPSAHWVARHVSNGAVQQVPVQPITLTCKACCDVMESIDDATDHLRVDHKQLICERFARLNPPREFRDMDSFVTVVMPSSRKKRLESDD